MSVIVPSVRSAVTPQSGGELIEVKTPRLPFDARYGMFTRAAPVHEALSRAAPGFVEASSPWRGAWIASEWRPDLPHSLFMHHEPVSAWAYRWFDSVFSRETIDTQITGWFWAHLKKLYERYDILVNAAPSTTARLRTAGVRNAVTCAMGVEEGVFSPSLRDEALRASLLARMRLDENAVLVLGVGRHTPEKRWPVLIEAVQRAGQSRPLGLIMIGDGHDRGRVMKEIAGDPHILPLAPVKDRRLFARILASSDLFLHGSNAETFGLAAAEAIASGLPMVGPNDGAVADLMRPEHAEQYRTGNAAAAAEAIHRLAERLSEARGAALEAARAPRTLDDHFEELFARYETLEADELRRMRA